MLRLLKELWDILEGEDIGVWYLTMSAQCVDINDIIAEWVN